MTKPTLTQSERIDLLLGLLTVGLRVLKTALLAPFRGSEGSPSFGKYIQATFVRALTNRLSVAQLQYLRGTSTGNFNKWAASHGHLALLSTEVLPEGTKIHWIGRRDNKNVIFHLHGGGYVLPLFQGHLELLSSLRDYVQKGTKTSVSVAVLEYTNVPKASYPTQFRQANIALRQLISSGINPSNIILSGDSAGGHIALCLLSHILHPHPEIEPPPELTSPLGGVLLISPRATNETTAPSFFSNSQRDVLSRETLSTFTTLFRSNSPITTDPGLRADRFYTEPLKAPPVWWNGFTDKVTTRLFISAGEFECFRDVIRVLAENMKMIPGLDVLFELEEKGVHDSPLWDAHRPPSDLVKNIQRWLVQTVETMPS
ncbi:alpha/beta-hydrolase [Marasmius fiardii PR-910]|nr:alpha/beta-hydrolase [Marasmius fiardii PR-910]